MVTFYNSINECILVNESLFDELSLSLINDFKYNSSSQLSLNEYSFKYEENDIVGFGFYKKNKPLLIVGNSFAGEGLATVIIEYGLTINSVLGDTNLLFHFNRKYNNFFNNTIDESNTKSYPSYEILVEEISYTKTNVAKCLLAGGCFWCMAKPYYEYDGVVKVYSGYAGGNKLNPTYEQVKEGNTGHKETILIYYEPKYISYRELLKIFFESINPFDEEGQFIDRGSNYQTAVFTDVSIQKATFTKYVKQIEEDYNQKVAVKLLPDTIFFKAEEHHQDFALKNKDKLQEEEKASGRNDFEYIKL